MKKFFQKILSLIKAFVVTKAYAPSPEDKEQWKKEETAETNESET